MSLTLGFVLQRHLKTCKPKRVERTNQSCHKENVSTNIMFKFTADLCGSRDCRRFLCRDCQWQQMVKALLKYTVVA